MIKSILVFGLTRSAIIVLGLVVFCAAGLVAFSRLNIEAYPNPAPVILEITAQAAGLSAEVSVRLRHGLDAQVTVDQAGVHLKVPGQGLGLPAQCETAIQALARGERHRAGALPGLDEADSLVVSRRLLRSGILVTDALA